MAFSAFAGILSYRADLGEEKKKKREEKARANLNMEMHVNVSNEPNACWKLPIELRPACSRIISGLE